MNVRTEHIREAVRHFVFEESADAFPALAAMQSAGECRFNGPIFVELSVGREMDHYRVEGAISVPVCQVCSRCLADFNRKVETDFTIFFREATGGEEYDESEVELEERDLVSATFTGDELDLGPEIGQQVALSIPLKPLCDDGCKGLCPTCGADLNIAVCGCPKEEKPSKFSALKDFKVKR